MARDEDEEGFPVGRVRFVRSTDKAILVEAADSRGLLDQGKQKWIPISQLHDDSSIYEESDPGEEGDLVVKPWLAHQEGWE